MLYDAIILAGGESTGELKKIAPYDNEALILIGNYPMIYYVYKAVRQSQHVRKVVISGPVEALRSIFTREKELYFVEGGDNAVESFAHALQFLKSMEVTEKVLVMPTDIPFITTEAIDDFVYQSQLEQADFYYPITSKEVNEKRFPGVSRTYVKLQEGVFTGGNLFILRSHRIEPVLDSALELVKRRKSPLAMARIFGMGLVWQFLRRKLTIAAVEQRFYEVLQIKGKAVISNFAEVGVDVDKPSDLALAQTHLGGHTF